jgi:hypothetical protein
LTTLQIAPKTLSIGFIKNLTLLTSWERLLWTSGGLLNLSKCLYYVVSWTFDSEGRASMTPASDIHPPITLSSGDSTTMKHTNI